MKKRKQRWFLPVIVILVVGVAIFFAVKGRRAKSAGNGPLNQEVPASAVMKVEKGDFQKTITASGYLSPQQIKDLVFSVSGRVVSDNLKVGRQVKKDEILVALDSTRQELDYLQAKRAYDLALINGLEREIKEAELNLKLAEKNLTATKLRAPFDGIITRDLVDVGDYVGTSDQYVVGTIIADGPYEIEVKISENESTQVAVGQKTIIKVEAIPDRRFEGRVKEVALQAVNESGVVSLPVKIVLTEESPLLKPEYSAEVEIIVEEIKDQIMVPITAIFNSRGQEQVMKIVDGRPVPTPVVTGPSNGFSVVIKEGLAPGDEIMINTYQFSGAGSNSGQRQPAPAPRAGIRFGR
ncbi:MAG: efflux RND transporter periplasmic adaptor subunit [Firmicutes bacterium]|nr:efflux RND transporter periplasmic adaptor subunit [Bacillota bacterium]